MKKYYFTENGKELKFGDMLELDLSKDLPNGKTHYQHMECKFHPMLVDMLLEAGIIEEREGKGKEKNTQEYTKEEMNPYVALDGILNSLEDIIGYLDEFNDRLTELEEAVAELLPDKSHK